MDSKQFKNTEYEFTLVDGTTVKTSIAFYLLNALRTKNEALYKRYNKILSSMDKNFDVLDMVTVVYVGYVCANLNNENLMTEEDFILGCGSQYTAVSKAFSALVRPK